MDSFYCQNVSVDVASMITFCYPRRKRESHNIKRALAEPSCHLFHNDFASVHNSLTVPDHFYAIRFHPINHVFTKLKILIT